MTEKLWYETSFRRNLVDMHIEDWDDEFLSQFDPESYFDCMKRGNIKSPMIYLQSHVGLCNWPSESGEMHKGFDGENKMLRLFELCNSDGMDVIGYYSLIFNNWAYNRFPDWRMRDVNGLSSREKDCTGIVCGGRYGILCPNNKEYREFTVRQLREMLDIYDMKGVFLDMAFWPMVCYCDSCKKRYKKEAGKEIPVKIDWNDSVWNAFQKKREEWMGEFAMFCTNAIKAVNPELSVEHNSANISNYWLFGVNEGPSEASDYTGGDLYGGHYHNSFMCKLYYEVTKNQPFEYMTSRCEQGLGDHTTIKTQDSLRLHNFITVANHGATLFIDAIDPRGTLNPKVYDLMGKVFEESIPYEKYLLGKMVSEIVIYHDLESKMNKQKQCDQKDTSYPQFDANIGAAIALTDYHYLYTVIPNCRKEKILDKKVVILSEAPLLSDEETEFLSEYVIKGGSLYISGDTNPNLVKQLLGLEVAGYTEEDITYISPTKEGSTYFGDIYTKEYPVTFGGRQVIAENKANQKVLATITLPYTNPADKTKFASIHSNPPGINTDIPSIVCGEYGKGRVVWSAASFESNAQKSHKEIFIKLIRFLYNGSQILNSDAPYFVQYTLFDSMEQNCSYFSVVNVQESMPVFKVNDFNVGIRLDKKVQAVKLLPQETEVGFSYTDGVLKFEVKDIDILNMYMIQYVS